MKGGFLGITFGGLLMLGGFFWMLPRTYAAITLVQSATSTFSGNALVASTTFSSTPAAGDLVVVALTLNTNSSPTFSVTDNKGNTYNQINQVQSTHTGTHGVALLYAQNVSSSPNFVVTATSNVGIASMVILEYSGISISAALDQSAESALTSVSTTVASGPIVTSLNGELYVVAQTHLSTVTTSPGIGWSDHVIATEDDNNFMPLSIEDWLGPTAGTYNGTFSLSSPEYSAAIIASFRPTTYIGKAQPGVLGQWSAGNTIKAQFNQAPVKGDLVIAGINFYNASNCGTLVSVKDGNGNSLTLTPTSPTSTNAGSGGCSYIAYELNTPSNASATVTATFTTSPGSGSDMYLDDFALGGGTASLDNAVAGSGTGVTVNTPTIPVTGSTDILYGIAAISGCTKSSGPFSPWTGNDAGVDVNSCYYAEYIAATSTANALNFPQNSSDNWNSQGASFSITPSSGGGGGAVSQEMTFQWIMD